MVSVSSTARVQGFSKQTNDVYNDSPQTARSVGTLKKNTTRLNVISGLSKTDRVDYFSFKTQGTIDNIGLGIASGGDAIQVQILGTNGQKVIADNSSNATTDQKKAYADAQAGKLKLDAGTYYLRITRGKATPSSATPTYIVQLSAGTYTQDYDTTERAVLQTWAQSTTTSDLAKMLTTGSKAPDGKSITNVFDFLA